MKMYECPDCGEKIDEDDVEFDCPFCGETDMGEGFYTCETVEHYLIMKAITGNVNSVKMMVHSKFTLKMRNV